MFHFVANLKPYTFDAARRFDAYLLSIDYLREHGARARAVRTDGRILCADNGNVDRIRALIAAHQAEAKALAALRKREEAALGGYARPGRLSAGLRDRYQALARTIEAAALAATAAETCRPVVAQQLAMEPSYLIGMEDFTIVALTGLDVEPAYSGLPAEFYQSCAARAVAAARETADGAFGPCAPRVLAGLHAIDLDTARAAGRLAADAGLPGIATGLVGALTDRNHVDFRVEDGRIVELGRAVPRPYLRVAEIVAGLHAGYAEVAGRRPRFHALGAGSPILLPLIALLGDRETYLATDSTAPIVDGWTCPTTSLYVDEPAPLKYRACAIAEAWLSGGRGWDCTCEACRAFDAAHPPDLARARDWWRAEGRPAVTPAALGPSSPLSACLPLLGHHADRALHRAAALARVAHNHEILRRLETAARAHGTSADRLRAWVAGVVDAYAASAGDGGWKAAIRAAHAIADRVAADLANL